MISHRIIALARQQDRKRQRLDNAIVRLEVEGEKMAEGFKELDKIWNEVKADTGYHLVNRWRE